MNWKSSKDYCKYVAVQKDSEIIISLSDSLFYYEKYQDIIFHFATGTYKRSIDENKIILNIDTLKSLDLINSLNKEHKRFILAPRFDIINFYINDDTLKCVYTYNKRKNFFNALISKDASHTSGSGM